MRYIVALLMALLPSVALAQEVHVGTGLICDTQAQVEQFVALSNEGVATEAAVERINAGTNGCAVLAVAYIRGDRVGEVRTKQGLAEVVHIIVVGVNVGMGWVRGPPLAQFTLFLTKEEAA